MMPAEPMDTEISEIMQYVEQNLRTNAVMRAELAAAVRRKDESAIRQVALAVWEGLKAVAPVALSIILAVFGWPSS
jgi:hypothetical protein